MKREGADGAVLRVVLDSPETLNSVDEEVLRTAAEAIEGAVAGGARVVVLTGAGRAFCSGANISGGASAATGSAVDTSVIEAANRLVTAITATPVPVVCGLNGLAAGVGVSIALACDLVVADEAAYYLLAFSKIGLMPDGGATALVAASLGRHRALRLALLAERLDVRTAEAAGLVSTIVPTDRFEDELAATAWRLAAAPTAALAQTKAAVNAASLPGLADALERELVGQQALLAGPDFAEGIAAFAAKRPPAFTGR